MARHPSTVKPRLRIVQPNPILGSSCWTMTGKTKPPVAEPAAAMPIARLFFLLKYVDTNASIGQNKQPFPRPVQTPCARKSCQYWVEREAIMIPKVLRMEPRKNMERK